MGKVQLMAVALLLVLLLLGCTPKATTPAPVEASKTPAPAKATEVTPAVRTPIAPAKPEWELEWDKTVAAAKKEGSVVLSTVIGGQLRQIITKPFESKYGVRIESMSATTAELATKIFAEQRAGIYSQDVWISGSGTYVTLKGALGSLDPMLILPDLTDPELVRKTWYFGELSWADKSHTMLISLMMFNEVITTNSTLVKAGEITTYRDLLNPKWKGKMSLQDPRLDTMGLMWFAVAQETGDVDVNFMRELAAKQDLFVTRDTRLQVDWLAHGKHAIGIAPSTAAFTEFLRVGAPLGRFSLGTPFVSGSTSGIAVMKATRHPNATRLFINWLLSQEGQTFHSQAIGGQSQRLDVPTTHLEPSKVLKPGLKLFRSDNEEFTTKRYDFYIKLAKEILGAY